MRKLTLAFASLLLLTVPLNAQVPRGFAPCTGNAPTALSVTNVTSNTLLSTCGGSLIILNIGTVEAFWDIGATVAITATTSSKSIPGGTYLMINVPTGAAYYLAAITSSSTTTIRLIQGIAN